MKLVLSTLVISSTLSSIPDAGLLHSNPTKDCFLHYSLTRSTSPDAPLLVWLQGGPGLSSQISNFFEIGDQRLSESPEPRESHRWSDFASLLFLDAPEGSGFSYCESPASLPRTSEDVATHIRHSLVAFVDKHPEFSNTTLLLAGEDYAGHILPPLAVLLLSQPLPQLHLGGLMIGNGHTHPVSQVLTRPESGKYFGLIEGGCLEDAHAFATAASFLAGSGRFEASFEMRSKLEASVRACAGGVNLKDIRTSEDFEGKMFETLETFMNSDQGRLLMGVSRPGQPEHIFKAHNPEVIQIMRSDVMRSVADYVAVVLDAQVPVLLYQGLFDWIDGVFSNEQWILDLDWRGKHNYNAVERQKWLIDGELVGFTRNYGPLTQVTVRNAGHSVPLTQPRVAFALAKDFTSAAVRKASVKA